MIGSWCGKGWVGMERMVQRLEIEQGQRRKGSLKDDCPGLSPSYLHRIIEINTEDQGTDEFYLEKRVVAPPAFRDQRDPPGSQQ